MQTRFETADGEVSVIDFMPPRSGHSELVRIVRGERGQVRMQMQLTIRFDYGLSVPWVESIGDRLLQAIVGPDLVVIKGAATLTHSDGTVMADFTVRSGEMVPVVIMHGASHDVAWREWLSDRPRNMTPSHGGSSAIFPRRSRTSGS